MAGVAMALQLVRIVPLLLLAFATGWAVTPLQRAVTMLDTEEMTRLSIIMVLVSFLFVVVLLVGRRRWHAWGVLIVEAVIALPLAVVPGALWMVWLGFSDWTYAMMSGWVQPLAIAWLGVVVARGIYQVRDGAPHPDTPLPPPTPYPNQVPPG